MSRVLVVDDQVALLRMLGENLSNRGYQVEYATTGSQAIERTELAPADAVILDLGLPDMSGMEVLARLRGQRLRHQAVRHGRAHGPAARRAARAGPGRRRAGDRDR